MSSLAETLRRRVQEVCPRLEALDEAEVTRARGEGKWIKKEILGHLIDSAANNQQRFVRARATRSFIWPGYDMDFWVVAHDYRQRPWRELLVIWVAYNTQVAQTIESAPEASLSVPCTIGDKGPEPLQWWMADYIRHLDHHLGQLLNG